MAILAAIDENQRSKHVVNIASDLATAYDDKLVALHVVPNEDYRTHREAIEGIPGLNDFSIDQEVESAAAFARRFVRELGEGVEMDRVQAQGRVGDVPTEILAEADVVDPRFLVISGRRRSPTGKAIFGNTTQRVLLNADCPVVTKLDDI